MTIEQQYMQRCLQLARLALGKTSPNPLVGSVIVKDDRVIGEGFHPGAGQPHAEVFALRQAGEEAKNATVYVNLEPCNHYGKTPPCTEALIAAGVAKVVVGIIDPDSRVAGSGVARLRSVGIEVIVGVEEEDCLEINEAFIHRVTHQRPFGILKYAMTLDGKIAAPTGHSSWITTEASRHQVHQLRSICDAVIVGGNTVRKDNPLLTTHGIGERSPLRIVMSRSLDLPQERHLWDVSIAPTIVFTEVGKNPRLQQYLQEQGVEIVEINDLTPDKVMENLYHRQLSTVLWECGGNLAAIAINSRTVQKILAFIAPKIIGGDGGFSPIGDLNLTLMSEALELNRVKFSLVEKDLLIEGYLSANS